jgi:hypothetical protein
MRSLLQVFTYDSIKAIRSGGNGMRRERFRVAIMSAEVEKA